MRRFISSLPFILVCQVLLAEEPKKLGADERKEQESKWVELDAAGYKAYQSARYPEAQEAYQAALELARRLYPRSEFPDGHNNLATSLNNMASLLLARGKLAQAEPFAREALEMYKRLTKGDSDMVVVGLNTLAMILKEQAKLPEAEPLFREALEMNRRLYKDDHLRVALSMNNLAYLYNTAGKYAEAETLHRDALAMTQRLFKGDNSNIVACQINLANLLVTQGKYAEAEDLCRAALESNQRLFKGDHPYVLAGLSNLARLLRTEGKLADAEALYSKSLDMSRRIYKGDHPLVAVKLVDLADHLQYVGNYLDAEKLLSEALDMYTRILKGDHPNLSVALSTLAAVHLKQGRLVEAERQARAALDMRQRLFKGDHTYVAVAFGDLSNVYRHQRDYAQAEELARQALEMHKRLFKGDHRDTAVIMNNLAGILQLEGKLADSEKLYRDVLAMSRRLFPGNHPTVATCLNNLGTVTQSQGKFAEAQDFFRAAIDMKKQLIRGENNDLAGCINNLASLHREQGNYAESILLCHEALAMNRRLIQSFATGKVEGQVLNLIATQPLIRDGFISTSRFAGAQAHDVYPEIWASKGLVSRVYDQRQQLARAAAADPAAARLFAALTEARQRRSELLLQTVSRDPLTQRQRDQEFQSLEKKIAELNQAILPLLPSIGQNEKLARAEPAQLQKLLPADQAVVDFLHYLYLENDSGKTGRVIRTITPRYLAFVLTRDKLSWIELDTVERIDAAVSSWRQGINLGKEISPAVPNRVRELVWEKVRKELPTGIKTVYISPDAGLCKLPWVALPGDKPGTILLEDFTLSTIPHAQFLLEHLWREPSRHAAASALIVGGVKYDAEAASSAVAKFASRGDPLVQPGTRPSWSFLPATIGELKGVAAAAERKKIPTLLMEGETATTASTLKALTGARYAHLATHGFFADSSFRSVFQLDEKEYQKAEWGERVGRAASNPMVMTGLVLAGANDPRTPGLGILTGESLIELDLSGLELAVLSACETGLGDLAGGEGTFGLQRAFHLAGTRNVVASLWKVPDQPTAALMALFYKNLWEKNLAPMESLRQAQLEIYKNPARIGELAKGFRGQFMEVSGNEVEIKPVDGKSHPLLWAAFTISGPGR